MFLALQTPVDLHTFKVLLGCELVPDLDHLTFETENIHCHFHFQNLAALDCWGLFCSPTGNECAIPVSSLVRSDNGKWYY